MLRVRITYTKSGGLRYTSNLDMHKIWERTMRRARLPVAFSQGFNPRPRFHMAAALPLGFTSRCELADLWLNQSIESAILIEKLQNSAPPGLVIDKIDEINTALPALQTQVKSSEYIAQFMILPERFDLTAAVQRVLTAASLPRIRREKPYDLRPLIEDLAILSPSSLVNFPQVSMLLSAREGATGRPDEVLAEMGLDATDARIERTKLILV